MQNIKNFLIKKKYSPEIFAIFFQSCSIEIDGMLKGIKLYIGSFKISSFIYEFRAQNNILIV